MKHTLLLVITFVGLAFAGCTSADINSAPSISVPSGLTTQDVKLAILLSIDPAKAPPEMNVDQQMTDNALRAFFGYAYSKHADRRGQWFLEEIRERSVLVGFDNRKHYFRAEFIIGDHAITQRIDGSRNLDQTSTKIHRATFDWLGMFETKIRQNMGTISALKSKN